MPRLIALLIAGLFVVGCGGDDDDDRAPSPPSSAPEQTVANVVRTWAAKPHSARVCDDYYTAELMRSLYGSEAACAREIATEKDAAFEQVRIGDVSISGDGSTARLQGRRQGAQDGEPQVTGTIRLEKSIPGWRISGFGDDFIISLLGGGVRGAFIEGMKEIDDPAVDRALEEADIEGCTSSTLKALGSARLQELGLQVLSDDDAEAAGREFGKDVIGCLAGSDDGKGIVRAMFEAGAVDGAPKEKAACVRKALRKEISDDLLMRYFREQDQGSPEYRQLQQAGARVREACS